MKSTGLIQLVDNLHQADKIHNLHQVCEVFGCVDEMEAGFIRTGRTLGASLHALTDSLTLVEYTNQRTMVPARIPSVTPNDKDDHQCSDLLRLCHLTKEFFRL